VDEAQQRHFRRWPILGQYVWPNPEPIPTSYAGELSALKNWLRDRLGWIDENLPDAGACADFADIEGTLRFSIYPNPMVSSAEVMVRSRFDQGMTLRVLDMTGREVLNEKQFIYRGNNRIPLNAPWWPAGIYLLEIRNTSGEGGRLRLVKVEP
jgi:hypothetical protein